MNELLIKNKEELQKSIAALERKQLEIIEQLVMTKGALQYNELLLKQINPEIIESDKIEIEKS